METNSKKYIFIISDFVANFGEKKNQLISADFNQLISYFPSDLGILDQNYNMGHFSHSILVTEPNSVVRIEKFQKFWNFLEFLESLYKYLKFGCFGQMVPYFHSILGRDFDSEVRIEKFKDSGIFQFRIPEIPKKFRNSRIFGIFQF